MKALFGWASLLVCLVCVLVMLAYRDVPAQVVPSKARIATFEWNLQELSGEVTNGWLEFEWDDGRTYLFRLSAVSALSFFPEGHPLGRHGLPAIEITAGATVMRIDLAPGSKLPENLFAPIEDIEKFGEVTIKRGVSPIKDD